MERVLVLNHQNLRSLPIFLSPVSHLNACKSYESSQALSQKVTKIYECLNQSTSRWTSVGFAETAVVYTRKLLNLFQIHQEWWKHSKVSNQKITSNKFTTYSISMVYLELNYESCCWCGRNKLRQTNSRRYTKAYIFYALPFLETVIAYCGCFW